MTDLPEPLTPADCDLRGLPFMPLDVVRLVDSDLVALATGDEFKAAVVLWCKAWLQVPAASLPDDDRILAHLSGAGSRWPKVKAVALRGWVKCGDGRLYHPVVAEKAREAWSFRQRQRERSARANAVRWGTPQASPPPSPRGSPRASPDDPKGQGQGQETQKDKPSVSGARGARLPDGWRPDPDMEGFAQGLGLDPRRIAASFADYWRAQPGEKGRKTDWPATWRNWCRREAERNGQRRGDSQPQSKLGWMLQ